MFRDRFPFVLAMVLLTCSCAVPERREAVAATTLGRTTASEEGGPERPLMRFPDIHGETIVFVYGEDIWSVSAAGGIATRLTIHDGAERYPRFSPDGSLIAFTGRYDGNADVYVMGGHGGNIRRVTYHPGFDEVIGWHSTKNKVLFRSTRNSIGRFNRACNWMKTLERSLPRNPKSRRKRVRK